MKLFSRSLLAICLAASSSAAFCADEARSADTIRTAVMLEQSIAELHLITPLSYSPVFVQPYMDPALGSSALMGGLAGAFIGSLLAAQAQIEAAQIGADNTIAPLLKPLGTPGVNGLLRKGLTESLQAHGMTLTGQVFSGKSEATPALFSRIPGATRNARWIIVKKGQEAGGQYGIPLGISDDLRHIRVAFKVEVWDGADRRPRLSAFQDVLYYSDPLRETPSHIAMAALEKHDQALLRAKVSASVADAVNLALAGKEDAPDVDGDEHVDVVNGTGAYRVPGRLLSNADGRAVVLTKGGTLVSIPADMLLP